MITLGKITCDYIVVLKTGELFTIPNIERELVFNPEEKCEELWISSDATDKIEAAIEAAYPNYYRPSRKTPNKK